MFGKIVDRLEEGVIALLLGAMTLLTFVQVVLRYVFEEGITWGLEATEYMFGWLIFLGMSYGVKKGAHIGVDAAVKLLPRRGQQVVGALGATACMVYAGVICYGAYVYVAKLHMIGINAQDIHVQRWILVAVLPLGFALLGLRFLQVFVRILMGRQTGLGLADEAADAMKLDAARGEGQTP